jgi:hypothetical protein
MSRRIYLLSNGSLSAMTESGFEKEDLLQQLLEKYPEILAGDQMDGAESRRWLLIAACVDVWACTISVQDPGTR